LSDKPIRTMEDFSEFVGLSRPTVSKYFNDPNSVRRKTRDLIEAALKQSGFRPNMFAVNLNRRRSNIIGIIIPNSTDPFYMALTRRVELIANDAGFLAFVLSSDGNAEMEARAIEMLKSMNVAGAIIAPLGVQSHHETLQSLSASIPLIFVDSPLDDVSPFVGTNNRQSFQLIVDYLCRSGEPPCYLGMPPVNTNAATRETAYIEAMHSCAWSRWCCRSPSQPSWDFERFGYEETTRIMQSGGLPTDRCSAPTTASRSERSQRPIRPASRSAVLPTATCASPATTTIRFRAMPVRRSPRLRRATTRSAVSPCSCCCASLMRKKPAHQSVVGTSRSCSMPRSFCANPRRFMQHVPSKSKRPAKWCHRT
jgi:DNA-binding LacI/PurR family transcriptional regulator